VRGRRIAVVEASGFTELPPRFAHPAQRAAPSRLTTD
jgi:hypothetical protein